MPPMRVRLRAVGFRGVQLCSAAASLALSGGDPGQARDLSDGQAPPMAKSDLLAPAVRNSCRPGSLPWLVERSPAVTCGLRLLPFQGPRAGRNLLSREPSRRALTRPAVPPRVRIACPTSCAPRDERTDFRVRQNAVVARRLSRKHVSVRC